MALELRPDQREVVKRLVNALSSAQWVALQAPTGWGKTLVGLAVIKELGAYPALWLVPRLSIAHHVYVHAVRMNMRSLVTAGREKMCVFNHYSIIDFVRGVCHGCKFNRPIALEEVSGIDDSMDFGRVREVAEVLQLCPYKLQTLLERYRDYNVIISHYNRARKLVNTLRPRLIIADEVHNVALPVIHRVNTRELRFLLEKLGFEGDEALGLVRSPETLRALLQEMVDSLIYVIDEDSETRPIIEELLSMLDSPIWYYDESEDAVTALEIPELPRANAKMILMSATLPPQFSGDNVIIVKRGWSVQAKIDTKYTLSLENISKRKNEISKYIDRYLQPGTVIFTTLSRESILPTNNDIIWEDELAEKGEVPCNIRDKIVVLKTFGRYAEGVDLNCFSRLIVLGPPLLPPHAMARLRARGISDVEFMTLKTAQILGRPTRSAEKPNTLPEIILIDRRFELIKDELRKYEIEVVNA